MELLEQEVAPEKEIERSNEELDALADQTDKARNSERPMHDEPVKETKKTEEEAYEFTHNGKAIKATRDQMIKWAQQGYDYPQRAQKLNQQQAQWNQEKQQWEQKWGVYRQIDDFAAKNPQWWNSVQQSWQTRGQAAATPQAQGGTAPNTGTPDPRIQALEQRFGQLEQFAQTLTEREQAQKVKEEDTKLEQEIQSIREGHKDLDWDSLDENGKTLEMRILEHAQATGIPTFRAALRDLLHDDLLSRAQAQAKQAVAKGIQNRTKLGVLGDQSNSKFARTERNKSIRDTSYEEIMAEAMAELRSGKTA